MTKKRGIFVDGFLRVAKTPMHMNKWLTAERWVDIIKKIFDLNRKEEELDVKFLNNALGRDKRLKRVIDIHSNLNTSVIFRHKKFIKRKIIVLYHCAIPGEMPSLTSLPNAYNINANITKTIGNQLIMKNQGAKYVQCMLSSTITSNNVGF